MAGFRATILVARTVELSAPNWHTAQQIATTVARQYDIPDVPAILHTLEAVDPPAAQIEPSPPPAA